MFQQEFRLKSSRWAFGALLAAALLFPSGLKAENSPLPTPDLAPQAQQGAQYCTGTVVDEEDEPLIGATVMVQGTNQGTATDIDGNFTLPNVKRGATIVVNYVGYKQAKGVFNGQPMGFKLETSATHLDEVVAIGYGVQQKRAKMTNSVAKVSEKTLTVGANSNPAQALAGAVSGVKVDVVSGDPSATPSITIRGGTSWGSANNPLVVVDGNIRSSLSDINPNDISSMEILKDAGATALYGARAANGVILVTTKQGKEGSASITLDMKVGLNSYNSGYNFVDVPTYLTYYRRAIAQGYQDFVDGTGWVTAGCYNNLSSNNQPAGIGRTKLDDSTIWNIMTMTDENKYLLQQGWQTMKDPLDGTTDIIYRDIDPAKVNIDNPRMTQDYNLSMSGGNDKGKYYASLGYYDADGALPKTFYKRYNFALTGSYKLAKFLEAQSVFTYTRANWNNTSNDLDNGYYFGRAMCVPHTARLLNEDNEPLFGIGSPGINLNLNADKYIRKNQSDKFAMNQSLIATIIPGLTVKGTMAWFYNEEFDEAFNKDMATNQAQTAWNRSRSSQASFSRIFDQTYNVVVNFNRTFAEKHSVNAMVGAEYYQHETKGFKASGSGAPTDDFMDLGLTDPGQKSPYKASTRSIDSSHAKNVIESYFARAEYDFDAKYLVAATLRADGYSKLVNHKWGVFPGVSAGWVYTREDFFQKLGLDWLNYGKVRASFGLNGIVNPDFIGDYNLQGSYNAYKYHGQTGYRVGSLPNPDLKWERTRTFEVGLDFGFLQNRANLGVTYYNRLTMDKYANKLLPQTTGFSSVVTNNGSYRNQGVEIDINATLLNTRDFHWNLGFNLTYNKNTIDKLPYNGEVRNRQDGTAVYVGPNAKDAQGNYLTEWIGGLQEGQEPNHVIGFKKSHMLRSAADVEAMGDYIDISRTSPSSKPIYANASGLARLQAMGLANGAIKLMPGDLVWKDRNGDNMIDTYDRYDLGGLVPHWSGGFNTTFSWKGLSLYARFDMGWGFKTYDSNLGWWLGCGQGSYSFPDQIHDTYTADNTGAKWPRYQWASNFGTDNWTRTSDLLCQNAAYLACRELSLSYELPTWICHKFAAQALRVSVTGQNLGYIKSCTNPLPDNTTYTTGTAAGWGGTYNLPRTVIFGLNLTF